MWRISHWLLCVSLKQYYYCFSRKIRGKHEVEFRDTLTGSGPYSLLSLAILFSWIDLACVLLRHGYNPNKYPLYDLSLDVKASMGELGEDFKKLVCCLFEAGYKFKTREEEQLDYLLGPLHSGFHEEIIHWLKSFNVPQSLQRICATCIRHKLRVHTRQASILRNIQHLNLPPAIRDYLCLDTYKLTNSTRQEVMDEDVDLLMLAMPRRKPTKRRHVYFEFWQQSCCWSK